jgi:peptidoglycan/LPS O-acetylase OafA/YrhL
MALGGLLAYYSIFNAGFRRWIQGMPRGWIGLLYGLALLVFLFRKIVFAGYFMVFERLFIGVLFGLIILEQNFSEHSIFKMKDYKWVSKMGIYTYGLYCLHVIAMNFTEQGLVKLGWDVRKTVTVVTIGCVGFAVAVGFALFSYYFFERRFLQLKDKFAFITH